MNAAKIQLSAEELQLVKNAGWVLTKNKIIQKVYVLFGDLSEEMKRKLQHIQLPEEILATTPKISRGEYYKGLPYVMLDYPRLFGRENIFAIRTFFWWGNYFSVTFHLKGVYKEMFIAVIQKNISLLAENNFSIGISENEWLHELDDDNYISLSGINADTLQQIYIQQPFLKFSVKISLDQWDESGMLLGKMFNILLQSIQA